jgi:tetratricopeptide (TPR) repeat protein
MQKKFALCVLSLSVSGSAAALPAQAPAEGALAQTMQEGSAAMAAGNFSRAVDAYTKATQVRPGFAEGYFNLGLAEQQQGQLDKAQAALKKALLLKPGLRGANLFLGILAYRQNRLQDAEASLNRETHIDPHSAKAWMWLGICDLAEDKPLAAIPPLDKAYALDPGDADILYHRGRAYFLVANASYAAMFRLDHDSVRVHQALAEAYAQSYRNDNAIQEFEIAARMAPRQPGLHEELGDQYWIVGKLDDAGKAYRHELENDAYAVTAKFKLGSLLVLNQDPAEGVQLLRQAIEADPSLQDAYYYLGKGLMRLGQNQEAIHPFQLAIAADPAADRAMDSYYKLAQIYRNLHNTPAAQDAMQNFLRMQSQSAEKHDRLVGQIARKRSELPVDDPEKSDRTGEAAAK